MARRRNAMIVCPTDVVRASAERLWQLVTTPTALARWSDTTVLDAADRELSPGDRLLLGAGPWRFAKVFLRVEDAVRPRRLALDIRLPLGITNREVIEIVPVDQHSCRVTFN